MNHKIQAENNLKRAREDKTDLTKAYAQMAIAHGILALIDTIEKRDGIKPTQYDLWVDGEKLDITGNEDAAELRKSIEKLADAINRSTAYR